MIARVLTWTVAGLAVCMLLALFGRAADWSPFALTLTGAIAGGIVMTVITINILDAELDHAAPADIPLQCRVAYITGYDTGYAQGIEAVAAQPPADPQYHADR